MTKLELAKSMLETIVTSSKVSEYAIGITGNPDTRLSSYKRVCEVSGFALIAWKIKTQKILKMESDLYDYIQNAPKKSSVFKKAHRRMFNNHHPSVNKKFEDHFVYIIW